MGEGSIKIDPSLQITEDEEWVYFTINQKTYKVMMTEVEKRELFDIVRVIDRDHRMDGLEEKASRSVYYVLKAIGAIIEQT